MKVLPRQRITVVIATHRRPDALKTALGSLHRQTLPASEFRVAVVIDGMDESERQYRGVIADARRQVAFALDSTFQTNAGQSVARHRAILAAATPWICVIDDDMDLEPGFVAA